MKLKGHQKRYKGITSDKKSYETLEEAVAALDAHTQRNPNDRTAIRLGPYKCRHCHLYHLGHIKLYDGRWKRQVKRDQVVVGKLIAVLKHLINGDPMPLSSREQWRLAHQEAGASTKNDAQRTIESHR